MKIIISAIALFAAFSPLVSAHGRLLNPKALDTGLHRLGGNDLCGPGVNPNKAGPATADLAPGTKQKGTWFVTNADGAGPLLIQIASGPGEKFQQATVTKQVPGTNVDDSLTLYLAKQRKTPVDFEFEVPNIKCAPGGCLMQVKQDISAEFLKKKGKIGGFGGTGSKDLDLTPAPVPGAKKKARKAGRKKSNPRKEEKKRKKDAKRDAKNRKNARR
ncbi:hypothetical protein HDU97_000796 [Phlyctochytrium planicorne]|nr:hypothetical protein HDU97_000796 [Phlyctochytrium planicorne]